jgi:4a-hydroxytetrahydrobiopterin dehydratase
LSEAELADRLRSLPGWAREGDTITKTFTLRDFRASMALVNKVADAAEAMNHHPDILVQYAKVRFTLSTHDAGGLSALDTNLAAQIEQLVADVVASGGGATK